MYHNTRPGRPLSPKRSTTYLLAICNQDHLFAYDALLICLLWQPVFVESAFHIHISVNDAT